MDYQRARNGFHGFIYRNLLKPVFFSFDPEDIHDLMTVGGSICGTNPITKTMIGAMYNYRHSSLEQEVAGIRFKNPIGLAAGFDKEAKLTSILHDIGFGFMEIGSITGRPCAGNPRPRLWRLKKSRAIVVYYGLKNAGCDSISKKLKGRMFQMPMGTSIAKTNDAGTTEIDAGIEDYVKAYTRFADIGSYSTINISCPNTCGGEPFTESDNLERLLKRIDAVPTKKPVFIKISPDLGKKTIDGILDVSGRHRIAGFVCTNLTKKRDNPMILDPQVPGVGGISGKVVEQLSDEMIGYIRKKVGGRFAIMGCGGVFTAEDAYRKIKMGASLIQLVTGMIYQGPHTISDINMGLVKLLKEDGYTNISQAIGTANG